MAILVFAKEFLDDFAKLEPKVRQAVRELPDKFGSGATHAGLHLEKLNGAVDERLRTVRVDLAYRGVVIRLGEGKYALLRVMHHDDAYRWAERQRFGVNPVTGIIEVVDVPTVAELIDTLHEVKGSDEPSLDTGLFGHRRDKEFMQLGVDDQLLPVLRRLASEDELLAVTSYLPAAQADAALLLAGEQEVDQIWAELQAAYAVDSTVGVDVEDFDTALKRPGSRAGFAVTTSDEELVELLSGDFEAWRTFLHPLQQNLAYKSVFNGPAKVTGGAGTGKTVVALHRAKYLAQQQLGHSGGGQILLATYTNSLAINLDRTLRSFANAEELRQIHVSTVDKLAQTVLAGERSGSRRLGGSGRSIGRPISGRELEDVADAAVLSSGIDELGFDGRFLIAEWEQIVLARQIRSLPEYATTPRPGRGSRLSRAARKQVWTGVEHLVIELERMGRRTFLQLADDAAQVLAARGAKPYRHVIIDEAQDLHPAQWRLIRAAVAEDVNDLFIVGDAHQRIYDYRVSLGSLGIETRGRSRRLKINYRTSQQILSWAQQVLTGQAIDDLDGELEDSRGYRSAFTGPRPEVMHYATPIEEAEHIADRVTEWLADGVMASSIGVTGRIRAVLEIVLEEFDRRGVARSEAGDDGPGVKVGTMHSMKGLEFARLAVIGVRDDVIPLPISLSDEASDPLQHAHDLLRERCLLYVACTRTRDALVVTSSGESSRFLALG